MPPKRSAPSSNLGCLVWLALLTETALAVGLVVAVALGVWGLTAVIDRLQIGG
jgi:uncharacterized membrane protein